MNFDALNAIDPAWSTEVKRITQNYDENHGIHVDAVLLAMTVNGATREAIGCPSRRSDFRTEVIEALDSAHIAAARMFGVALGPLQRKANHDPEASKPLAAPTAIGPVADQAAPKRMIEDMVAVGKSNGLVDADLDVLMNHYTGRTLRTYMSRREVDTVIRMIRSNQWKKDLPAFFEDWKGRHA